MSTANSTHSPRVVVVQDGARLHYAVPVALQRNGALERMYTPWYVRPNPLSSLLVKLATTIDPIRGKRFAERRHSALDTSRIYTNPFLSFKHVRSRKKFGSDAKFWAWESADTGEWIARAGFGQGNGLFGFVRNISPRLCEHAAQHGLTVVVDQMIATIREEARQQRIQAERFPAWAGNTATSQADEDALDAIESQTWARSHAITCASDYVKQALIDHGIGSEKIHVLPYPIDASQFEFEDRSRRNGPIVVGFVGSVGLRKGTPYLLKVAEKLKSQNLKFEIVGGAPSDPSVLGNLANVTFRGHLPRSEISAQLARFDILFFPSTCEGSPGAVMEAMASGLPVVTTPNSGTVVRHGMDGFIHPYDDIDALASSIEQLASSEQLRLSMGRASRERAESFNLAQYGQSLVKVYSDLLNR